MHTQMREQIIAILRQPLEHRCRELKAYFETASLYELNNIFPILISHIFDLSGAGWNLRRITRENAPRDYDTLCQFFSALNGPMIALCYRLLEKSQFEVPLGHLPVKMQQMLISRKFPPFYSQLTTKDPFTHQIIGLSLNSLDYFLLFFALHGTVPYHAIHREMSIWTPLARDRRKTVYLMLAVDYALIYVPSNPDMSPLALRVPTPKYGQRGDAAKKPVTRKLKYLMVPPDWLKQPEDLPQQRMNSLMATVHLRAESLIFIFMDVWLSTDIEISAEYDVVRYLRILVKQLHVFTFCVAFATDPRIKKLLQNIDDHIRPRFACFLRPLFMYWPLDETFVDVLELWLSYVQPWRYYDNQLNNILDRNIPPQFVAFIANNLNVYTEMCAWVVKRVLESDADIRFSAGLLGRIFKVFGQYNLIELLRTREHVHLAEHVHPDDVVSIAEMTGKYCQLVAHPFNDDNPQLLLVRQAYVPLFTEEFYDMLEELMKRLCRASNHNGRLLEKLRLSYKRMNSLWTQLLQSKLDKYSPWREPSFSEVTYGKRIEALADTQKRLESAVMLLEQTFYIAPQFDEPNVQEVLDEFNFMFPVPDPILVGDSMLDPIQNNECAFLVRFLYQTSGKLNTMYGDVFQRLWYESGIKGRIARNFLMPPISFLEFVHRPRPSIGRCGRKVAINREIGARVNLRVLASYSTIGTIIGSFILGYVVFGAPSFGFLGLLLLTFLYLVLKPNRLME